MPVQMYWVSDRRLLIAKGRLYGARDLGFVLDADGVPRFASGIDSDDNFLLYASDAEGGNWQQVPPEQHGGRFSPFALAPGADSVFATYSVNNGPASLVRSSLVGGERAVLAEDGFGNGCRSRARATASTRTRTTSPSIAGWRRSWTGTSAPGNPRDASGASGIPQREAAVLQLAHRRQRRLADPAHAPR